MTPTHPLVVDWFRVFVDLARVGISPRQISVEIAVPRGTLLGWKQGAIPKWDEGERLIELWCSRTQRGRDELPRTERFVSAARACR